jgi:uncharacterized protein YerC
LSKSGIPDSSLCGLTLSSCAAFSVSPLLAVKKSLADATLGDVVALASMKSMAQRWLVASNIRKKSGPSEEFHVFISSREISASLINLLSILGD